MRTEPKHESIRVQEGRPAKTRLDPEELWLYPDMSPEDYIEFAEHPELADPVLASLPSRDLSLQEEALFLEQVKAELRAKHNADLIQPAAQRAGAFSEEGSN